ncbi:MAG: HDIG domain-containing metalloprotein, partial [Planctomycetota bacterium]
GSKSARSRRRRVAVRRQSLTPGELATLLIRSPAFGWAAAIAVVFSLAAAALMHWSRQQPLVAIDQPARETVQTRVPIETENIEATQAERDQARWREPNVYVPDLDAIESLVLSLKSLPVTVTNEDTIEGLPPALQNALTDEASALLQSQLDADGELLRVWTERAETMRSLIERRPILSGEDFERESEALGREIRLAFPSGTRTARAEGVIDLSDPASLDRAAREMAQSALVPSPLHGVIAAAFAGSQLPTFIYDQAATVRARQAAEDAVLPSIQPIPDRARIFEKGRPVTAADLRLFEQERAAYRNQTPLLAAAGRMAGLLVIAMVVAACVGAYIGTSSPQIRRNPTRMAVLAGSMLAALSLSVLLTTASPPLRGLTLLGPLVLLVSLITVAYRAGLAVVVGVAQSVLIAVALREAPSTVAAMLAAVAVSAWQLSDLRDRRSLIRAGATIGGVLAAAFAGATLVALPPESPALWSSVLTNAASAAVGGVMMTAATLFALPSLERLFDITTGMTLIELRDPKQPLLRELQRRAPGTYNHSLNVASISEQAAEAIGADALLTYAGVLYHDIGKMNKPEYFVENQSGGPNKHDKLSPAMSLLVIVGHVKDGLELAREFGLPRRLHHFIEAHHGTTLVEYFYERARRQAEDGERDSDALPDEIEYRYPGPKPQTREVAIVMIADAVESATRTMSEPTASRIESLVHTIARKRLEDGQFDECGLTLRDLRIIIDSIAKSVTAIYHGRIAYPARAADDGR